MQFRTLVKIDKAKFELSPRKPIVMMGSCFTDNIGAKFRNAMWNVEANPCGVQYNPASIAQLVARVLSGKDIEISELVEKDGLWQSWLFDSHFSSPLADDALECINSAMRKTRDQILASQCFIITLGTAWIYRIADDNRIVSNCHKFPASMFERSRLSVDEIVDMMNEMIRQVREVNPKIRFVFTVSPIRHFKDGAHQNTVSKSTLLLAVEKLCNMAEGVEYFPAYEIMMDELRDYRFYASDMVHPSQVAVDYIWDRFREWCFSAEAEMITKEAVKLTARLNHRSITGDVAKIEAFNSKTKSLVEDLINRYPYLKVFKTSDTM